MAQSSAAAAATSHHRRKRARHHRNSGVGGSMVKDIQTVEMREAINRDGEMGGVLLERGYLGAKLYTGPDFTTGLLPGQHDQILAEMKWVHADVVGLKDLKQAQCRRVASAVKDYWRVRKKQQEQGGGQHVRLGKMVDGIESRHQGEPTVALTKASADDILMMDRHGDEAVFSDEESQYSNAAEARASIDPLRDIIDRLNDASAVWMPDKGPPIQSATSSGSSSTILRPAVMSSISDDHHDDDDAAVCSTLFVPGVVGFPDPVAEPRWRMNELLSNQRTLLHEMQFSEAARARLPALFTAMVREMSTHPVGDQESVVKTPQSIPSAVAKSQVPGRYKKPAIAATAATAAQQQGGMVPVTQSWDERENLLLLAALARALPRCFDQKSSSTHFMVERRREILRGSAAADLQDDSMDLVTGLVHGVSWRTVEIGMRCTMEGIAGHDKIRSNSSCARRANEMLTERRPMIPPTGTIWRGSLEGMVREKQRQVGLPVDVHIDQSADHSVDEATPTVVEQTLSKVNDGGLEKPFGKQEDALALFHYRRGLTTPTFAAFCPTKSVSSVMVVGRRRGLGDSAYSRIGQTRWRLPRVRKCIQKSSSATSVSSPLVYRRRRGGRGGRQCSSIMRASMSRLAIPVSFSEPLKAWDEYIVTTSHQNSCRWLTTAVTLMGAARRRRASECREMRVLQWEAPPIGSPTSPLALRNAHANALLALQKYASVSMGGASVKQPNSCMGSEAMRLLTFAAHKMKEQMTDNGSGIQVAPTKHPMPEKYRRIKVSTTLPVAAGGCAAGVHVMGKSSSHQFAAGPRQQEASGLVMGKDSAGGAYQGTSATANPQQQPQHLAQVLPIRNATVAATTAVRQQGGNEQQQQQPMQQYIMAKRSQMQSVGGGLQNQQQLKMALGSGSKAPSPIPQRGASQGIGVQTTGAKMSQAAVQSLLQSMLSQQQGQQRAGAAVAAAAPNAQSTITRQQSSNQAAAAAGGPMGRANLGNLNQLYQSLLTQFTHGTAGIRHQGGVTPAGPASPSPSASAAGGGVGSGTRTMPVLQNMLQNIFANNRSGSGYSTATTPKGSGIRAQQGASITATPSLQQQQQQRPPYQQFYYGNAVGGGTSIPSKAVFPGPKAPSPAAAYGNSGGPSGPGV